MSDKAGRNDPCPCGSGKKYKKCCWQKDNAAGMQKHNVKQLSGLANLMQRAYTEPAPEAKPLSDRISRGKPIAKPPESSDESESLES